MYAKVKRVHVVESIELEQGGELRGLRNNRSCTNKTFVVKHLCDNIKKKINVVYSTLINLKKTYGRLASLYAVNTI